MQVADIVPTGVVLGVVLVMPIGGLSRAEPIQTEAGLFAAAGECIEISRNLVGIVTVAAVKNKCNDPFTVVIYTTEGPKVINAAPHFQAKWNTTLFSRWKVCPGVSNPSC
jgi:hypothetical protein